MEKGGKQMDYEQVVTLVQTVGFPIVMCGALFWYMITQRTAHKVEVEKMTDALNNNTVVLQKLASIIEGKNNVGD